MGKKVGNYLPSNGNPSLSPSFHFVSLSIIYSITLAYFGQIFFPLKKLISETRLNMRHMENVTGTK
jgi:hypothetical protein